MSKKTKIVKCVGCGKDIEVSKFMSALKARCQDCKNGSRRGSSSNTSKAPRIDGPPNKALSRLCCPYHPDHRMTVIGVIKSSKWGDIVSLQCRVDGCWTLVQISEQHRHMGPLRSKVHGIGFESEEDVSRFVEHMKNGNVDTLIDTQEV